MTSTHAQSSTLAVAAYTQLEEMIVTLALAPGSLVSEARLSDQLGIGRTPIREALQRLAADHLVVVLPKRGIVISEVHSEQHLLALEVRRALEAVIAHGAVRRSRTGERAQLRTLAQEIEIAASHRDEQAFLAVDREFNALLAACARNPYAAQAISPLHSLSRRYWYIHQRDNDDIAQSAALHAAYMRAVADSRLSEALAAADALVTYAATVTRNVIATHHSSLLPSIT